MIEFISLAGVAELADALDSKSSALKSVRVQVPPPAQKLPSLGAYYYAKMTGTIPVIFFLFYRIFSSGPINLFNMS